MLHENMEVDNNIALEFQNLTTNDVEFTKKCSKISLDIKLGTFTVLQLVEQLGTLLVDPSPNNRELGTWILTQVLEGLPSGHLDENQLTFICHFYADRLKDHHQVIPAVLKGVLTISAFARFPRGSVAEILNAISQNVPCQQQQQGDRQIMYRIFETLLDRCAKEVADMGLEFVYLVISSVDGERDPKNLLFIFKWFPKFLRQVQLRHLVEEAFEIMACYFPVDFKAPPQDAKSITREQLAENLAPCLCAIPDFAEFCLPLALEKLSSSLEIAKLDSLKLLETGCLSFETASYVQHASEIWSQIQKELLSNPKPEIELVCYSTLSSVIKKLSQDSSINSTLKDIIDTVKGNLLPDSKLFEPSSKLLLNIATASQISAKLVTKEIVPLLTNTFNITTTPDHKISILRISIEMVLVYCNLFSCIDWEDLNVVPVLCLKALIGETDTLQIVGLEGLTKLSKYLPLDVRLSTYKNLQKMLVIPQKKEVRCSVLNCFEKLAEFYSEEVKQHLINNVTATDLSTLRLYLDALITIAPQDCFRNYVIDNLLSYVLNGPELAVVAISSLRTLVETNEDDDNIQTALAEKGFLRQLITWAINHKGRIENSCLKNLAFVVKCLLGYQTKSRQEEVAKEELPRILQLSSKENGCTLYVVLLDAILSRLRRDVQINYDLLEDLTVVALEENNDFVRNVAVQLLANLLNKCSDENVLANYLNKFGASQSRGQNYVTTIAWITKALVVRNHGSANNLIDKLIEMLKCNDNVAVSFRVIMDDSFDSLSIKSYSNRTLLYRQKFFTVVSRKLNESYKPEYSAYLTALGYLLEYAPQQAILMQFKKILKLVTLCLEQCCEVEVLCVILQVLKDFIDNKESCIEDHIEEFLSRILKLASFDKSMKVRILALQCVQKFATSFPVFKLLPLKQEVVSVLGKCLDDKKRFVRREAVEARTSWFLLDAPM